MKIFAFTLSFALITTISSYAHDEEEESFQSIEGRTVEEIQNYKSTELQLEELLEDINAYVPTYSELQEILDTLDEQGEDAALEEMGIDTSQLSAISQNQITGLLSTLHQERADKTIPPELSSKLNSISNEIVENFDLSTISTSDTYQSIQDKRQEYIEEVVAELAAEYDLSETQQALLAEELFSMSNADATEKIIAHLAKKLEKEDLDSKLSTSTDEDDDKDENNNTNSSNDSSKSSTPSRYSSNNNSSNSQPTMSQQTKDYMQQAQNQFFSPTNFGLDGEVISKKESGKNANRGRVVYETNCDKDKLIVAKGATTTGEKSSRMAAPTSTTCHMVTDGWISRLNTQADCFMQGYKAARGGAEPAEKKVILECGYMYSNRKANGANCQSRHSYSMACDGTKITVGDDTFLYKNFTLGIEKDTKFFAKFKQCWETSFKDGSPCKSKSTSSEASSASQLKTITSSTGKPKGMLDFGDNAAHNNHYHLTVPFCGEPRPAGACSQ